MVTWNGLGPVLIMQNRRRRRPVPRYRCRVGGGRAWDMPLPYHVRGHKRVPCGKGRRGGFGVGVGGIVDPLDRRNAGGSRLVSVDVERINWRA